MNKCEKCGFLHYRTDPCRAGKPVSIEPALVPKPKRSGNRHRPGYFTEYMRGYRARQKADKIQLKQRQYRAEKKAAK